MNEHGHPNRVDDLVEQIDALTDDAASWSATGEHIRDWWSQPAPGAMTAVELTMIGGAPTEISATNPVSAIADRIGDPGVDRISPLRTVAFWVGGNSVAHRPVNSGATTFLHHLLADVRDGNYLASDAERDHARALLAADDSPEIHGPCLVTGFADDGYIPAPLDENFQSWFTGVLDELAQRASLTHLIGHAVAHAVARALGIPPEQLHDITVVASED